MSIPLLAHRIRSGSIHLGLLASVITFLLLEVYALPDQWEIGRASVSLMLAILSAGVSTGLFLVIAAIGMIANGFFSEWSPEQSQGPSAIKRAEATDHPRRPYPEAQGIIPKALVLICDIDTDAKSLPINFNQHQMLPEVNAGLGEFTLLR